MVGMVQRDSVLHELLDGEIDDDCPDEKRRCKDSMKFNSIEAAFNDWSRYERSS